MWQFIAGVFVGAAFGVSLMCLFVAGNRADDEMLNDENWKGRKIKEQADKKKNEGNIQ